MPHHERRRHVRIGVRVETVFCFAEDVSEATSIKGVAEDLSRQGMRGRIADAELSRAGIRLVRGMTVQALLHFQRVEDPVFVSGAVSWLEFLAGPSRTLGEWVFGLHFPEENEELSKALAHVEKPAVRRSSPSVRVKDIVAGIEVSRTARRIERDETKF